jgi:hypothetical protein
VAALAKVVHFLALAFKGDPAPDLFLAFKTRVFAVAFLRLNFHQVVLGA